MQEGDGGAVFLEQSGMGLPELTEVLGYRDGGLGRQGEGVGIIVGPRGVVGQLQDETDETEPEDTKHHVPVYPPQPRPGA